MKRSIAFLLTLALLLSCCPIIPLEAKAATSGTCGDNLTWTLDDEGTLAISGTGSMDNESPWYAYASSIKTVVIESGVTTIGDYAFSNCGSLTSVTISDSVTTIGIEAFYNCKNLVAVFITDIAAWCAIDFGRSHSSDTDVTSNPLYYGAKLYLNGALITDLEIPDGVTTVGSWAFCYQDFDSVTIPNSVTTIGDFAFFESEINELKIGTGLKKIKQNAFSYCKWDVTYLSDLAAWCGIELELDSAFAGDDPEATIYTPLSFAKKIYIDGKHCENLVIPEGVTEIKHHTFNAVNMISVTIPDSVTTIGVGAFNYCDDLTDVYYTGSAAQWAQISVEDFNDDLTNATIHYNHVHDFSLIPPKVVAATCTTEGYTEYTCAYGETYRGETTPALGHDYIAGDTVVAPTCTEEGYTVGVCSRCGGNGQMNFVPALGHDYSGDQTVVAPTCTEAGYTATGCIRCTAQEKGETTAALGHKMALLPAEDATCIESGLTQGTACERCGLVGIAQTVVPAQGHDEITHAAQAPTCTAIGWDAYVTCSRCDYSSYEEIAALGHDEITHAAQAPTCTVIGWDAYVTCSRCDYSTYNEIAALGHASTELPAVEPTCSKSGLTAGVVCDRCGTAELPQTVIPATGHSYTDGVCTVCGTAESVGNDKLTDSNGNYFGSLTEAIAAVGLGEKLTILKDIIEDVTVSKSVSIDLNGFSINGTLTIEDGCILYGMDVQTDDYTINDGKGYGKIKNVVLEGSGKLKGKDADGDRHGYMMIKEDDGVSFHCVNLKLNAMTLRAESTGVYFKSDFAGDELVAENVKQFGVALSVKGMPTAETMDKDCIFSKFEDFEQGFNGVGKNSTLLKNIMKKSNAASINNRNANMPVYGRAYILTNDGQYIFGTSASRTLRQQVEAIDTMWTGLSEEQRTSVQQMYADFANVMKYWTLPNLKETIA